MSYIVFARKYRPQVFDDVIGQSHITTTLKNAIAKSCVAHAYLFAGPRGVGKTTTARILAKALNCEKGPSPKPCNVCASCKEITQGSSLDILEIDGASNNGIEQIRALRENVKFAPSRGRFKIYIIDEVHMLSPEAFNALLKTLEEPPPHIKFIFATTHPHKVPATILSRCQRFDFRRIATKEMFENLKRISKEEALDVKDEALRLIAKYGDGSMRDAQVILDQMSSFRLGKVGLDDLTNMLGIVDDEILFGLSGAVKGKDPAGALKIIDALINDGKDVVQLVIDLIEHFRNISVAKISKDFDLLTGISPEKVRRYKEESDAFSIEDILYIIYTLSNTIDFIRKSSLARIPFEAALIKLTQAGSMISLAEISERLGALESLEKNGCSRPLDRARDSLRSQSAVDPSTELGAPFGRSPQSTPRQSSGLPSVAVHGPQIKADTEKKDTVSAATPAPTNLDEIFSAWGKLVNYIKPKKISVASYLQEGYPLSVDSKNLSIGFSKEYQFHRETLESPENKQLIAEAIKEVLGMDLKISLAVVEPTGAKGPSGAYSEDAFADGSSGTGGGNTEEADSIVKAALDIFSGKIAAGGNGKGKK